MWFGCSAPEISLHGCMPCALKNHRRTLTRVVGQRCEDDLPRRADRGCEGGRVPADAFGARAHGTGQQFHRDVHVADVAELSPWGVRLA